MTFPRLLPCGTVSYRSGVRLCAQYYLSHARPSCLTWPNSLCLLFLPCCRLDALSYYSLASEDRLLDIISSYLSRISLTGLGNRLSTLSPQRQQGYIPGNTMAQYSSGSFKEEEAKESHQSTSLSNDDIERVVVPIIPLDSAGQDPFGDETDSKVKYRTLHWW